MDIEICADCKGNKTINLLFSVVPCTACGGSGKQQVAAKGILTLVEMLKVGRYDFVNPEITQEHFPVRAELFSTVKTRLFHFNRRMTTAQIKAAIRKDGYEPASIEQLLAYDLEYPEEQRVYPIVGLGSSWVSPDGRRCVPHLGERDRERDVRLGWGDPCDLWSWYFRFLASGK